MIKKMHKEALKFKSVLVIINSNFKQRSEIGAMWL